MSLGVILDDLMRKFDKSSMVPYHSAREGPHVYNYLQALYYKSMPIEDLKLAQQAHEEELRKKADEVESEKAQKAAQKEKAEQEYEPRMDLIAQQEALREGVKQMEANKIQERMEQTKALKESEYAKAEELSATSEELSVAEEELRQIQELVAGKTDEEIADVVKTALSETSKKLGETKLKHRNISAVLEQIKSGQVSDEEITKYNEVKSAISNIEEKIREMESNPELAKMMETEAREEWGQRKKIIDDVFRYMNAYGNEEQQKVLEEITQGYIDEELNALGINQIRNMEERMKATKDCLTYFGYGMRGGGINTNNEYQKTAQKAAGGLKALFNGSTFTENAIDQLLGELPPKEYKTDIEWKKDRPQRLNAVVERHSGTINRMRAYGLGMKEYRLDVAPGTYQGGDRLGKLANEISSGSDFLVTPEGPLVKNDASPAERKAIEAEFQRTKSKAGAVEEKMREKEIVKLGAEVERANQELSEMQTRIAETIEAEKVVEREEGYGRTGPKFAELISEKELEIKSINKDLEESQAKLDSLSMFSLGEKKRYRLRIEHDSREIPRSERDLAELKQRKEVYENAKRLLSKSLGRESGRSGHVYEKFATSPNLLLEKAKQENWIKDKKQRLERLQKSGETK